MKILIVDDVPSNLRVLRATLEGWDIELFEAAHGAEALALLEREPIDAVISDLQMPTMDGYRFCKELRRHQRFHDLPFIAYTSSHNCPEDEQLALALGADKYMHKPASAKDLTDALNELIRRGYVIHPLASPPSNKSPRAGLCQETVAEKLVRRRRELLLQTSHLHAASEQLQRLAQSISRVLWNQPDPSLSPPTGPGPDAPPRDNPQAL
jgi:CheY-like chemotaxis protein